MIRGVGLGVEGVIIVTGGGIVIREVGVQIGIGGVLLHLEVGAGTGIGDVLPLRGVEIGRIGDVTIPREAGVGIVMMTGGGGDRGVGGRMIDASSHKQVRLSYRNLVYESFLSCSSRSKTERGAEDSVSTTNICTLRYQYPI